METGLLVVLVFVMVTAGFVFAALLLGRFLRPPLEHTPLKDDPYECGEPPFHGAWFNFNPRFYLIALMFVILDVEIALVYPVAVVFRGFVDRGQGVVALAEIALFVLVLLAALFYLWARGDLRWIKDTRGWR